MNNDDIGKNKRTEIINEIRKTKEIKKIEDKSKKDRILPLIGLGFGIILLSLSFYKLNKQSKNG